MQRRPTKFDPKKPQILIVEVDETLRDAMERQRMRTGYGGGFFIYFNREPKPSKPTRGPTPAFA
jgi:hypothetical protein